MKLIEMNSNTVWKIASDDEIFATLKNWGAFLSAEKSANAAYPALGCVPIVWKYLT